MSLGLMLLLGLMALVAAGAEVGAAGSTTNDVSEYDGQYPLVPWKVAITL